MTQRRCDCTRTDSAEGEIWLPIAEAEAKTWDRERDFRDALIRIAYDGHDRIVQASIAFEVLAKHRPDYRPPVIDVQNA